MEVRALTFDVFGTLLDWRSTIAGAFRDSGLEADPEAQVYLTGVRVLGLEPGGVMMVAAHPMDLEGARGAGLRTAFIDRPLEYGPNSPARGDPEADLSVNDLEELAARLEGEIP